MTKLLNLLSLLTASSPETLLNTRAELGIGKLSNKEELSFVVETLVDDMIRMFDPNKASKQNIVELVAIMIEDHLKKNDKKFIVIFNRVIVHFYGADLNDSNAFVTAFVNFSKDIEQSLISEYGENTSVLNLAELINTKCNLPTFQEVIKDFAVESGIDEENIQSWMILFECLRIGIEDHSLDNVIISGESVAEFLDVHLINYCFEILSLSKQSKLTEKELFKKAYDLFKWMFDPKDYENTYQIASGFAIKFSQRIKDNKKNNGTSFGEYINGQIELLELIDFWCEDKDSFDLIKKSIAHLFIDAPQLQRKTATPWMILYIVVVTYINELDRAGQKLRVGGRDLKSYIDTNLPDVLDDLIKAESSNSYPDKEIFYAAYNAIEWMCEGWAVTSYERCQYYTSLISNQEIVNLITLFDEEKSVNTNKPYDKTIEMLESNPNLQSAMQIQYIELAEKIERELLAEEEKRFAEERRIAKEREAEKARQTAERKRIAEKQKAEEDARRIVEERIARKKHLRQAIIICIVGLFIFVSFTLYKNVFTPMFYRQANELFENKQYAKAISKFNMANDYNDSKEKIYECYYSIAMNLLESDEFSKAIVDFEKANGFNDAKVKIRECHYLLAMNLFKNEQFSKAYSEFELADDFKDSEEQAQNSYSKYMEGENASKKLTTFFGSGDDHSVFLKKDGTVFAKGAEKGKSYDQCDVASWKDIIAIAAGHYHTVGLKKDGTVVAVGSETGSFGQCDVASWNDIVAIAARGYLTVGLKKDGTVVAAGSMIYGEYDVTSWKDIVAVAIGFDYIVGLKKDGTVICTGSNDYNQSDTASWKDIVTIDTGFRCTYGLKKDGTVVAAGNNMDEEYVASMRGIVAIAAGDDFVIGLKTDGTIDELYCNNRYNAASWKDIVAIAAGDEYIVGLKKDGKVKAIGLNDLESKISSLGGIAIP